jgi:AraC family transcriptional regulator, positive regulator of tynA and feaB
MFHGAELSAEARASRPLKRDTIVDIQYSNDILELGFEELQSLLESFLATQVHAEGDDLKACKARVQPLSVCGLPAFDLSGTHLSGLERAQRHVRLDGGDDYLATLVLAGRVAISQNDRVVDLACGDLSLVETARPLDSYFEKGCVRGFSFKLPRQRVISHLGYEPRGVLSSRGTLAGKLIYQVAAEVLARENPDPAQRDDYMQLAIYDLLCATFVQPDDDPRSTRHTAKLFARVRSIVRDGFADPDLSPAQVAAAAGISLRYLQKLFTPQGTTCSHFIHATRLDHAARLLRRRALPTKKLPLSEIAFASGFRDYRFFARKFRQRFGCGPGAYDQGD